ncbi:hypothetical protein C5E07_14985 [Pseudoclavibacter sp. RFBJ3]|uniref:DUF308 domain-containing protein n=1 Tax=unclassified Pseudoclavibacter TaxID=2615177 RepID=UPI000CE8C7B7|nr:MULTISPECIES: DUF308 domain-containing protein [unclassified Pseudoclavibacter]MBF4551169.1 hypothetical protein [Pseudoclavibacter sp. VKM Ac-2888]PPF81569.1 hypothetical protein C5C12_14730 [Pseudoclavibacter sp. RFBJ5]PPF90899.1 hypothetical protein C5E07_14985 [Pseudoclavibacter sp. RFBJ3]PPG00175.1 hypothetical protein C5C19_02895 [Pseudoclavibacter sp. RFBH5]PPG20033.1 hypothetical protein C5E13_14930 [Pseudoclavibacter sp. RFBI4]
MSDPTGGAGERDPNAPVPQNSAPQEGDAAASQAPQAAFGDQPGGAEQGSSNGYGVGSSYGSSGDNYQAPGNYTAPGGSYESPGSASGYQGGQSSYSGSTGSSVPSASSNSGYSTPNYGSSSDNSSYGASSDNSYSSPSAGSYTGDTSYTAPSASGSDYSAPSYGSTPDYSAGNGYGNDSAPGSYGSAPAPDAYGASAQNNAYGSAPAPDAYGTSGQGNAYGAQSQDPNAAPGAYGAAPAYGAAGGAGGGQQQQYGNYAPQGKGGFNVLGLIATIAGALALLICLIPFAGYFLAIVFALAAIGLGIAGLVVKRFNAKKLFAIIGVALGGIALLGGWAITLATSAGVAQDISDEATTQIDELSDESSGELEIELTITSTGTSPVDITYSYENGLAGSDRVQVDTEALATAVPWSETTTMKYEASYGYDSTLASVSASHSDYNDQSELSCTLTVNGTVIVEASSSSYVSCYDSNLSQYALAE